MDISGAQYIEESGGKIGYCDLYGVWSFEGDMDDEVEHGPNEPSDKVAQTAHTILPWIDAVWELEDDYPDLIHDIWLNGRLPDAMEERSVAAFFDALFIR